MDTALVEVAYMKDPCNSWTKIGKSNHSDIYARVLASEGHPNSSSRGLCESQNFSSLSNKRYTIQKLCTEVWVRICFRFEVEIAHSNDFFFPVFTYLSRTHYKQVFEVIFKEQVVSEMAKIKGLSLIDLIQFLINQCL